MSEAVLLHVAVRGVFAYLVLLALVRASGKRTVAQGTALDFVLALILGDMVDDMLWGDTPAASFVIAVGTLTLVHTLVFWGQYVSPRFGRVVEGSPSVLMRAGQPDADALRSEHVTESELEELLRLWGVPRERWDEVQTALLETDGLPTLARTELARPAERGDLDGGRR
jgi:uncharacterized membrane protein YcaP (DUF421 family)